MVMSLKINKSVKLEGDNDEIAFVAEIEGLRGLFEFCLTIF